MTPTCLGSAVPSLTLARKTNGLGINSCISVGFGSVRALRARWRAARRGSTRSHNGRCHMRHIERRRPFLWIRLGEPAARDRRSVCLAVASGMGGGVLALRWLRVQNHARRGPHQAASAREDVGRLARPHGDDDAFETQPLPSPMSRRLHCAPDSSTSSLRPRTMSLSSSRHWDC